MRPVKLDLTPDNVDPDGLADGNSSAGATLTLDGALTSGGSYTSVDTLGHRLSILDTGANDQSGATYTITGTDADNKAQTEDIAGPTASGTVTTSKYFKTVTSVSIDTPVATSTVDMGTVDEIASKMVIIPHQVVSPAAVKVEGTGTANYSVETTFHNPWDTDVTDQNSMDWIDDANFTGKTVAVANNLAVIGVRAVRVVTNSYTDGLILEVHIVPVG